MVPNRERLGIPISHFFERQKLPANNAFFGSLNPVDAVCTKFPNLPRLVVCYISNLVVVHAVHHLVGVLKEASTGLDEVAAGIGDVTGLVETLRKGTKA